MKHMDVWARHNVAHETNTQGSDTRVRTPKNQWVFWLHPPKKPTLLL